MTKHSKLSPSASDKWLHCQAYVQYSAGQPNKTNVYADSGTDMHSMAETCLTYGKDTKDLYGVNIPVVQEYLDYCRGLQTSTSTWKIEERVKIMKGCSGTCDLLIYDRGHLHIIDLKTGSSPVKADSSQLKLYAIGALKLYKKCEKVTLHIVQPKAKTSTYSTTPEKLKVFKKIAKIAGKEALSEDHMETAYDSKRCYYCAGARVCPAYLASRNPVKEETLTFD